MEEENKKKVLIIEDDGVDFETIFGKSKKVRDLIEIIPSNIEDDFDLMCQSLQSDNPYSYIDKVIKENYMNLRCIICDLHLFDDSISGDDIIKHIRTDLTINNCPDFTKFIPIIIYTNYSKDAITKTALLAGGDFYISKPYITAKTDNYVWDIVRSQCERFNELCERFIITNRSKHDKPKVFIGSSSQALDIARALASKLDDIAYPVVWEDAFDMGGTTVEQLEKMIDQYDYSVFIFNNDDTTFLKSDSKLEVTVPRDNVILEYGMFLSKHGRNKTFFIVPDQRDNADKIHIATDLLGVHWAKYDPNAIKETNVNAAINSAYTKLKKMIK